MQTIHLRMCNTQSPRYSYDVLKVLQNSHNASGFWLNHMYQFITETGNSVAVQSLKNGFLSFYATSTVLASHFFVSKFSVQVLSQANLIYTLPEGTPSRIHRVLRWGAPTHVTNMHVTPHRLFALLS